MVKKTLIALSAIAAFGIVAPSFADDDDRENSHRNEMNRDAHHHEQNDNERNRNAYNRNVHGDAHDAYQHRLNVINSNHEGYQRDRYHNEHNRNWDNRNAYRDNTRFRQDNRDARHGDYGNRYTRFVGKHDSKGRECLYFDKHHVRQIRNSCA